VALDGPEGGCDPKWIACLGDEAALKLEKNLRAQRAWIQEAWTRCGPLPAAQPADAGT